MFFETHAQLLPDIGEGGIEPIMKSVPKRKIKDSVFTDLFQNKKYLLQLYRALYQENEETIIGQYIIFSKVYNEQRKLYGATQKAVTETIRICKDRNVLKEYLENREQEVVDIMMTLFDDDQILKAYTQDIIEENTKENAKQTAMKLIKTGKMSLVEIADCVPSLSIDELKELEMKAMQLV